MSTIPFTPIEGYLALPRVRPLVHVPAPFGRDWALLPPGYSLRAELKALYAAMLRTFCLSDQAIRSLCRWSPLGEQSAVVASDAPGSAAIAVQAEDLAASPETIAQMADGPVAGASAVAPAYGATARGYGNHWGVLAGGACVVGGAAVLVWIGLDHLANLQTAGPVRGLVPTQPDSRIADVRPRVMADAPVVGHARVKAPATNTASATTAAAASASASARASASASALASLPPTHAPSASSAVGATRSRTASGRAPVEALASTSARISADQTGSVRHHPLREQSAGQQEQKRPHNPRFASANRSSHAAAIGIDLPGTAAPTVAAGMPPGLSAAGRYSPAAPARLGVDEYADLTMSAAIRRHDIASLSRVGSSTTASGNGGTEWINHLSQRRVTEIPDQFAK